jgi:hypothetical protein
MKTTTIVATVITSILAIILLFGVSLMGYGVSTYNTATDLKNQYEAKISANKADFDNVKKVILQTAQVSKTQLDKLQEIYVKYADARTSDVTGAVMNWVQEAVPNIDTSTMNNLQNIIVSSRNSWTNRQKELVDISREYNLLLVKFPSNILLSVFGFKKIDPLVITSTETEKAFETGKDDNTNVF